MTKEKLFQILTDNVIEVLEDTTPEMITAEKRLKDLGANSVDRLDIVTMIMENLELKVPLVEFAAVESIGDLADFFYAKKSAALSDNVR